MRIGRALRRGGAREVPRPHVLQRAGRRSGDDRDHRQPARRRRRDRHGERREGRARRSDAHLRGLEPQRHGAPRRESSLRSDPRFCGGRQHRDAKLRADGRAQPFPARTAPNSSSTRDRTRQAQLRLGGPRQLGAISRWRISRASRKTGHGAHPVQVLAGRDHRRARRALARADRAQTSARFLSSRTRASAFSV